jgi:site-specific DNA recombinase
MVDRYVALYARVSTEQQARDATIASQVAALREHIAADGRQLEPDRAYLDEGYSGSSLLRPALERLRDAVAAGDIERLYVHTPDRLARRYAHQVLLMEEFRRAGAEVVFLNRPIGGTAEDDLLLQIQGVIAEYERAKILERSRRGRRHAARAGLVSAFTTAPFGYRYVAKDQGGGVARFEVVPEEARMVRLIFAWVGLERLSLREACRRLERAGCPTRRGSTRWYASTVRGMLANTAYIGRAVYGHSRFLPARPRLRPIRGHPRPSPRPTARVAVPQEEWIEVPVPPLVDPAVFEAVQAQLGENRRRKRDGRRGPRWLLQGLTVCRRCGYAYYGKAAPRSKRDPSRGEYRHYRCIGTDGCRFGGSAVCDNPPVRGDHLEAAVWERVRTLLEKPERVVEEYHRRLDAARDATAEPDEVRELDRQIAALRRGIGRLIDGYAEGVLDRGEFEPRVAGLKVRVARLEKRRRAAAEAAEAERELTLVVGQLEDFAAKVRHGLDGLNGHGRRDIIRSLVRRIEIDGNRVEVVFRVPPPSGGRDPGEPSSVPNPWQLCTGDHHPALEQGLEAGVLAALDDLQPPTAGSGHRHCGGVALIGAVGEDHLDEGEQPACGTQHRQGSVTVLDVGGMNHGTQQEAQRIDQDVPLLALDLLARIVTARINARPPFSALLTLWLSRIAAAGLASLPACSRAWTKSAWCRRLSVPSQVHSVR